MLTSEQRRLAKIGLVYSVSVYLLTQWMFSTDRLDFWGAAVWGVSNVIIMLFIISCIFPHSSGGAADE